MKYCHGSLKEFVIRPNETIMPCVDSLELALQVKLDGYNYLLFMTTNDVIKFAVLDFTISSRQSVKAKAKLFQKIGMLKFTTTAMLCKKAGRIII